MEQKVNLNTASKDELSRTKSIGPERAERIVRYREENGRFNSVEDVRNVQGFESERLQDVQRELTV
ncbi:MAG: helix-hairpin-helix domain-containing protein [Bdellovibrionales bacterium]|nr:helix-hairpin-helix domain-containing protein [Bdellovibrionales bacterium]